MDYKVATSLPTSPLVHHDLSISSADSDNESREHKKSVRTKVGHGRNSSIANMKTQTSDKSFHGEYDNGSPNFGSPQSSTQSRPPKDFVCPITSHISVIHSLSREVLRTTVYILSELLVADERLREILTNVDLECLAALLQNGLSEAAVLIYLLKPSFSQLSEFNLVPYIIQNICKKDEESKDSELVMNPKDAAVELVAQVLIEGDETSRNSNALSVYIYRSCRNLIATRIDLCYVLELFHAGNEYVRGLCIEFLWELVQLNRRTLCNQILQIIKDEGACSTMHTLLVYLQNAPMEQQPVIASLLLQLDLLKNEIYREEAIQTLIESLPKKDFPNSQLAALDALSSLSGHLSASGKSLTEAWLLKLAGFDQPYEDSVKKENLKVNEHEPIENMDKEEEIAANCWGEKDSFCTLQP
ncbi:unnamed protein product [Lactuca virosa]|uniref:Uncharacterized protein n=1 Tax=Lactuca virosa TaxID=75947 RepID=A0AAU9P853_9ASTR|nr:unnamed protein product [Lactuca virosa]